MLRRRYREKRAHAARASLSGIGSFEAALVQVSLLGVRSPMLLRILTEHLCRGARADERCEEGREEGGKNGVAALSLRWEKFREGFVARHSKPQES